MLQGSDEDSYQDVYVLFPEDDKPEDDKKVEMKKTFFPTFRDYNFFDREAVGLNLSHISQEIVNESNETFCLRLEFSQNRLTNQISLLKDVLQHCNINRLVLNQTYLSSEDIFSLFFHLNKNPNKIIELNLRDNTFDLASAQSLAEHLQNNHQLQSLDLLGCKFEQEGMQLILTAIQSHPSISTLKIDINPKHNINHLLFETIATHSSLTELSLLFIENDPNLLFLIFSAINYKMTVNRLYLYDCGSVEITEEMINAFEQNLSVTEYVGPDSKDNTIKKIAERNHRLECYHNLQALPVDKQKDKIILDTPIACTSSLTFLSYQATLKKRHSSLKELPEYFLDTLRTRAFENAIKFYRLK